MKQKTSLIEINGSFYLRIPPPLKKDLELEVGDDKVEIEDDKGRHGKFAAFWPVKKE